MNSENSPKFVTMAKAVELMSQRAGVSSNAAAQLIDLLNDVPHEGRPGLFEMAGAARNAVTNPEGRYVEVINALDALRHGTPAAGFGCAEAEVLYRMRCESAGRRLPTEEEAFREKTAVLHRVKVMVSEFEEFTGIARQVPSASAPVAALPASAPPPAMAAPAPVVVPAEGAEIPRERDARRLREFRALDGLVLVSGGVATLGGKRGALQELADRERAAGRRRSDRSDISKGLKAEALRQSAPG